MILKLESEFYFFVACTCNERRIPYRCAVCGLPVERRASEWNEGHEYIFGLVVMWVDFLREFNRGLHVSPAITLQ